jgi:hypothetical protein
VRFAQLARRGSTAERSQSHPRARGRARVRHTRATRAPRARRQHRAEHRSRRARRSRSGEAGARALPSGAGSCAARFLCRDAGCGRRERRDAPVPLARRPTERARATRRCDPQRRARARTAPPRTRSRSRASCAAALLASGSDAHRVRPRCITCWCTKGPSRPPTHRIESTCRSARVPERRTRSRTGRRTRP